MNLFIFTFSPVQSFISASRRPRDLFTASYILSYLTEQIIESLKSDLKELVYPQAYKSQKKDLANYPNRIVAVIENKSIEKKAKEKFKEIWREIYSSVLDNINLKDEIIEQFKEQVENYFSVFSICIPFVDKNKWKEILSVRTNEDFNADNYGYTYDLAERILGAKKSWRPYKAQVDNYTYEVEINGKQENLFPDGCTMCGERVHLAIDWSRENIKKIFGEEDARHIRKGEKLCGVCLTKRFAVKYYFKVKRILHEDFWHYPSTEEIAGIKFKGVLAQKLRNEKDIEDLKGSISNLIDELKDTPYFLKKKPINIDEYIELDSELFRIEGWESLFKDIELLLEKDKAKELKKKLADLVYKIKEKWNIEHKNPYFALLISDGDSIGDWLGIKSRIRKRALDKDFHKNFSLKLSQYAKEISEFLNNKYPRVMIYAGGDDVMALMHPFDVVSYAKECNKKFNLIFKDYTKEGREASISAGILITHAKMNLQKVFNETRELEKRAKNVKGKGAVCVGVLTRSGNMTSFVSKWEDIELYEELVRAFKKGYISSSFVYDLRMITETFSEEDVDIFLSQLRRSLKRKSLKGYDWEKLFSYMECFIRKTKHYIESSPINNLINLLYVARFVGTLKEVDVDEIV